MRRDFLKWCAAAGLGLAVPEFAGIAQGADKAKGKGKAKAKEPAKERTIPRLRRALLPRVQRLGRLGHNLLDGSKRDGRDQPPL